MSVGTAAGLRNVWRQGLIAVASGFILGFVVPLGLAAGGCTEAPSHATSKVQGAPSIPKPVAAPESASLFQAQAQAQAQAASKPKPGSEWAGKSGNSPQTARQARVSARGYGRVDLSLPRLRHEGGAWQLSGDPVPLSDGKGDADAKPVVLEGKMILDDSLPRRRRFWVAPHYDGCVDKHERVHRPHWVRVELPEGRSVQVTDQPLYLQGVARRVGAEELVFDAQVVQIQASVVPQGGAR